ncbi:sigma D regulator [Celerinatantimonas yamalensis]|uniref:Sigma D regulator n=1 Tax=Celerinatantimonas yamalensis TaxID=559956 RepID=A0ABW9GAG9_9GAMM
MLKRVAQAQQRWGGANQSIDNWLTARKNLLVEYCQLVGQKQSKPLDGAEQIEAVQHFCHHLVDYVSTGHFGIFDQIIDDCQDYQRVDGYISQLTASTDQVLDFYDRFNNVAEVSELNHFIAVLSSLGESLEQRFSIEDKLLGELYQHTVDEQSPA